jgi:hypothetical protein
MKIPTPTYKYSDRVVIREWKTGSITVQVGYVTKHPEKNCIVLQKSWQGEGGLRTEKFNIRDAPDWRSIREAVERLWPEIGEEPTGAAIDDAIRKVSGEVELIQLIAKYPEILSGIPRDIDIFKLPEDQKKAVRELLTAGGEIAAAVIEKLTDQPVEDLEQFVHILQELRLSTVNSLVNHVKSRISFIDMFEKAIHDDASYERRGKDSIHNLLKANIWILDRNFSILHDDVTLKTIIEKEWGGELDKEEGDKRPDFLCLTPPTSGGESPNRIVLVEIKRPSVTLTLRHVEQLMDYRQILQKHSGQPIGDFRCYLIGREIDPKLQANDLSHSGFIVKTYTDFIQDARKFYAEYLKIVEAESYAV